MSVEYDRFMKVIAENGGLPIDKDELAAEDIEDAVLDMGFDPIWATKILLSALDLVNTEFERPDHKADVFQSVLTVQGFTFAIVVGVIVVLNSLVGFG